MGRKRISITPGTKFSALTAMRFIGMSNHPASIWEFECICGKRIKVVASYVLQGVKKSCGCLYVNPRITHGLCGTKIYRKWKKMVQRCCNKNNPAYPFYGGRGIKLCKRWRNFNNFLKDMGEPPNKSYSIDRINNDGPYSPSNCRWATYTQQNRNSRNARKVKYKGETKCITEWARDYGMPPMLVINRMNTLNWPFEKALLTPKRPKLPNKNKQ